MICTMVPIELNYKIYNKELLTIHKALKHWQSYLEDTTHVVLVMSDHKNLKYFTTTKVLTCEQARQTKYLSGFNYTIRYPWDARGQAQCTYVTSRCLPQQQSGVCKG